MHWMKRLLHAVGLLPQEQQVTVGAVYRLDSDTSNPFDSEVLVTVKDIKQGWVLYAVHPVGTGLFQNESKTVKGFLAIYREKEMKRQLLNGGVDD